MSKLNFQPLALCFILSAALVAPAWGQAKEAPGQKPAPAMTQPQAQAPKGPAQAQAVGHKMMGDHFRQLRMKMIKGMKLPPDKEKALLAVEDKYVEQRHATIENMKKAHKDLQAAMAVAKPDEAKVKGLVDTLLSGQDELFNSFKSQRDEEMALLTPVEQGKYLLMMSKMRHEIMKKAKHHKGKK
jgi:Spy/CpxP family protein refolding chaperone